MTSDTRPPAGDGFEPIEADLHTHLLSLVREYDAAFVIRPRAASIALAVAALSAGGHIVVVESDPADARSLRAVVARNPASRIEVVEASVGPADTTKTTTLDTIAARTVLPDFLLIDLKESPLGALEGATEILRHRPSVIAATGSRTDESACLELLRDSGYDPVIVDRRPGRPGRYPRWIIGRGKAHLYYPRAAADPSDPGTPPPSA